MQDKCVMCGEIIPEGRQVCPRCVADHPANKTVAAMRDKLIALIDQDQCPDPYSCSKDCKYVKLPNCHSARIADHLLANGVIVPPCKVGDTVYFLMGGFAEEMKVIRLNLALKPNDKHLFDYLTEFDDFGKTVFLTKEEAEQALKGGEG